MSIKLKHSILVLFIIKVVIFIVLDKIRLTCRYTQTAEKRKLHDEKYDY